MSFAMRPLAEIALVRMGSPAPQGAEYFSCDGKPFVRVQDVGRVGRTLALLDTKDRINELAIRTFRPTFARKGSIVFPKSGAAISTNSRAILGTDAYVVSHLAIIEADAAVVDTEWLYFYLCKIDMGTLSRTATLPSLRLSEVGQLPVPVPPLPEQRRIVVRIKECMARINEVEGLTKSIVQESKHLPQAVRFDLWQECLARCALVELGTIATSTKNGLYKPREYHGSGAPLIRLFNINGADFDISRLERLSVTAEELEDYSILNGDIVISRVNSRDLVGKSTVVVGLSEPAVFEAMLIRLRVDASKVRTDVLTWLMNAPQFLHALRMRAKHAIGQSSINQKDLHKSLVPIPSIAEQEEISQRFSEFGDLTASLKNECASQWRATHGLLDAVLNKAFAGDL